jgi:hypothetical protein
MLFTVKPNQYIFPPRAANAIPRDQTDFLGEAGWTAQIKFNDTRLIIKYCIGGKIELWNRHEELIKGYTTPPSMLKQLQDLGTGLGLDKDKVSMVDGGLLHNKHSAIKATIVVWDILVKNNKYLIGTEYQDRYEILRPKETGDPLLIQYVYRDYWEFEGLHLGIKLTDDIFIPENWPYEKWDELWDLIKTVNTPYDHPLLEGLFFKDPHGELQIAHRPKNNEDWNMRSRVKTGRHLF